MGDEITGSKSEWNELVESEERFRTLAESTPVAVLLFQDDRWVFLNRAAEEITGYGRDELLGMNFWSIVHPDHKAMVEDRGKRRQAGEAVDPRYEFKIVTKQGRVRWVLLNGATTHLGGRPAGLINVIDITTLKRTQEELEATNEELEATNEELNATNEELIASQTELETSERRYRELFENFPVGLYQASLDGTVLTVNPEMARMLGYASIKDLMAHEKNMEGFFMEALDAQKLRAMADSGSDVNDYVTRFRRQDGGVVWVSINTRVRLDPGGKGGFLEGYIRDFTAQKSAEEEKELLERQLLQAQKMEAVGRLAGGIAHDFNNLLTAILGNAELSLAALDDPEIVRENLDDIIRISTRASELTRQLLAFSRKQMIKPVKLDLNEVLASMERMLRRVIGENIDLSIEPHREPGFIEADPTQMEQLIVNMIVNARDAMPRGGRIMISLTNELVTYGESLKKPGLYPGLYVALRISDNGIGMDRETQEKIFEPFFTTKGEAGTGLGLATVYGVVKQNGGYISLESAPGKGATFTVLLPRVEHAGMKPPRPAVKKTGVVRPSATSETILLVEDEEPVRKLISKALALQGYHVIESKSGADAEKEVAAASAHIDLILSDVVLPDTTGPELVEKLAARLADTHVLYMSGYAEQAIMTRAMINRGVQFIPKPFLLNDLFGKIREILSGD
jgi:two-component system, cell cycle sensor histidine kinase and response regulator CckA